MSFSKYLLFLGYLAVSAFAAPAPQNWPPGNPSPLSSSTTSSVVISTGTPTTTNVASTSASASAFASASSSSFNSLSLLGSPSTVPAPSASATTTPSGIPSTGTACPASFPAAQCYKDDSDFPAASTWLSWECLASTNYPSMLYADHDSPDEAHNVISAVYSVAQTAGIDPRIAFAVVMQESTGKVRPIHGDNGASAGIFQVQVPSPATCDGTSYGGCPMSTITAMAQEGIYGHNGTDSAPVAPGLAYWLHAEGNNVGLAVRGYNTGSIPNDRDLTDININGKTMGTPAYASDIANRLVGALIGSPRPYAC